MKKSTLNRKHHDIAFDVRQNPEMGNLVKDFTRIRKNDIVSLPSLAAFASMLRKSVG